MSQQSLDVPHPPIQGAYLGHLRKPRAHMIDCSPNSYTPALCGQSPWPSLWFGTGNQNEIDKLAAMDRCLKCLAVWRKREALMNPEQVPHNPIAGHWSVD